MSWFSRRSVTQKFASLYFRLKGTHRLAIEHSSHYWKSESLGSLRKLIRSNQSDSFGRLHDFHRIKNHADFQRLVPIGNYTGNDYKNQHQSEKESLSRANAITKIFELVAGWHNWNIFSQDWLIASNLYSQALSWTPIPYWLKLLSFSPAEYFNPDWNGIFTSADCLALGTLDSLLGQRVTNFPSKPALVLSEFSGEEIGLINTVSKKIPKNLTFIPIWREAIGPIAIHDPLNGLMRFLSLENLYLELLVNKKNNLQKRFALGEVEQGMEGEILLSAPGIWARPTGVFIKIEDAKHLFFSFSNQTEKAIDNHSKISLTQTSYFTKEVALPHPQKVGTSAMLVKTASHNPW